MSVGGPIHPRDNCTADTDVCRMGYHRWCSGTLQHRPIVVTTQDGEQITLRTDDHPCRCTCHTRTQ